MEKIKKSAWIVHPDYNINIETVSHRIHIDFNKVNNIEIIGGRVEDYLSDLLSTEENGSNIAMVDPPRMGLNDQVRQYLIDTRKLSHIMYLSCNPESLVRDLGEFVLKGWEIQSITPFDFFPKTKHLETLVLLSSFPTSPTNSINSTNSKKG